MVDDTRIVEREREREEGRRTEEELFRWWCLVDSSRQKKSKPAYTVRKP